MTDCKLESSQDEKLNVVWKPEVARPTHILQCLQGTHTSQRSISRPSLVQEECILAEPEAQRGLDAVDHRHTGSGRW